MHSNNSPPSIAVPVINIVPAPAQPVAVSEDIVSATIQNFARTHLTIYRLQSTDVGKLSFDGAVPVIQPDVSHGKKIWDIVSELVNAPENWLANDRYVLNTESNSQQKGKAKVEKIDCTVGVTKNNVAPGDEQTFTVEITRIDREKPDNHPPAAEVTPITVKPVDNSMNVITPDAEIDSKNMILRSFQTYAFIELAKSIRNKENQALCLLGPGSGKSLVMAAMRASLRSTFKDKGQFVCILPTRQLALQFRDDVNRSDPKYADDKSLVVSSNCDLSQWRDACNTPDKFLILNATDPDYQAKRDMALSKSAMVMVDEAHKISVDEWRYIQDRCGYLLALTGSATDDLLTKAFIDKVIFTFSTADAIRLNLVRDVKLHIVDGHVPNDRLFMHIYDRHISLAAVSSDTHSPLCALSQKAFIFCLDKKAEAKKICDDLIRLASGVTEDQTSEHSQFEFKLQMSYLRASKKLEEKLNKTIRSQYSPGTSFQLTYEWHEEHGSVRQVPNRFAIDLQQAQQSQLAASINALALSVIFGETFENYHELIVTKSHGSVLKVKQADVALYNHWKNEQDPVVKNAIGKANSCVTKLDATANLSESEIRAKISAMLNTALLPDDQKQILLDYACSAASQMRDAIQNNNSLKSALLPIHVIDLDLFGARFADVVYEDTADDDANRILAQLRYGFVMNLVTQSVTSSGLHFSTGTSEPSVLGLMVHKPKGSYNEVSKDPITAMQILARNMRGWRGRSFTTLLDDTEDAPFKFAALNPLEDDQLATIDKANDNLRRRRDTERHVRATRNRYSPTRRANHEAVEHTPPVVRVHRPSPTRVKVKHMVGVIETSITSAESLEKKPASTVSERFKKGVRSVKGFFQGDSHGKRDGNDNNDKGSNFTI